jgi:hypothetical protein
MTISISRHALRAYLNRVSGGLTMWYKTMTMKGGMRWRRRFAGKPSEKPPAHQCGDVALARREETPF